MPKLWEASIEGHRRAVREAITETTWRLAEERGTLGLTMSQVAKATGIGRATLYKYFADVESILIARHAQHVEDHLRHLDALRGGSGPAGPRLVAVVSAYASICFHRQRSATTDVGALVHRGPAVAEAEERLRRLFATLIDEAAAEGLARADVGSEQLAAYCLHALPAAGHATDHEELSRLVRVVLDGLGCSLDLHEADEGVATTSHDRPASRLD